MGADPARHTGPLRLSAETQGFFTRTDALSAGHDDNSIRRALKVRLWTRVRAGAYTYPELWPPDAESRHWIRGRAVAGKLGVDVALSHTTSSIVHDLRHWQVDLDLVHVTRLDAGAGRTESGVVHHSGLVLPSDLVEEHGIRRTHAARAAIETGSLTSTESALVALDCQFILILAADLPTLGHILGGNTHMAVVERVAQRADHHPDQPYIVYNDAPKLVHLKQLFPALYKGG